MAGHEGLRAGVLAGEEALAKAWLELAKAWPRSGAGGDTAHLLSAPVSGAGAFQERWGSTWFHLLTWPSHRRAEPTLGLPMAFWAPNIIIPPSRTSQPSTEWAQMTHMDRMPTPC